MGSSGADKILCDGENGGSETTIEIKIKTLDSQTYTLKVDKQMPVPALKEQIASVTGVLSEQQRLICRGRVLKDDQLLSAYHVEDGHTLHLVVRQPGLPSSDGPPNHSATDPQSGTSRGYGSHIAPNVVIETFNMPDQGDGVPPEISRIVSAVLGSFGFANIGSGSHGVDVREYSSHQTPSASGMSDSSQLQTEQASTRTQYDTPNTAFGVPTAASLGPLQPPVIPDSLATLSQYLSQMRREFYSTGRGGGNDPQAVPVSRTEDGGFNSTSREGLPTPASLAEVLLSTRQLLNEQAGECLLQLARQLEDQANVNDPVARLSVQSNAWRIGILFHNLGSFLLELGRTTMTVRLGQTPTEAVVNAGPAVFISPSGPNPLMVQPLPFQSGSSFGAIPMGTVQTGSGLVNGLGTGLLPRRIDIQIRRGSSMATSNANREERGNSERPSGERSQATGSGGENRGVQTSSRVSENSSFPGESGVRVVPIRTMVAAVPAPFGRVPSDSGVNSMGLYYPVLGRLQHVASGAVSDRQVSQASGEQLPADVQLERQSIPASTDQQQNTEAARDGSMPNPNSGQRERPSARTVNINILSAGGTQNSQESERQIPGSVLQFLRNIFPGGEIHVEDPNIQAGPTASVPEHASTSHGTAAPESSVTDQGIFLSNLLRQIMPLISQQATGQQSSVPLEEADSPAQAENSNIGTSRRQSDSEPSPPNSKRQKIE